MSGRGPAYLLWWWVVGFIGMWRGWMYWSFSRSALGRCGSVALGQAGCFVGDSRRLLRMPGQFDGSGGTELSRAAFSRSFPSFSRSFLLPVADAAVWVGRCEDPLTSAAVARAGSGRKSVG